MKDLTLLLLMILIFLPQSLQLRNQSNIRIGNRRDHVEKTAVHHVEKPAPTTHHNNNNNNEMFTFGIIAPHTNFGRRDYIRAINSTILTLQKTLTKRNMSMFTTNNTKYIFDMMPLTPSPTSEWNSFALLEYVGTRRETVFPMFINIFLQFNSHSKCYVQGFSAKQCVGNSLSDE